MQIREAGALLQRHWERCAVPDFSVFINTGQEFDGSDAGARPDEAVSWGKIKPTTEAVKIYGEATIVFPLLVAETFARDFHGLPAAVGETMSDRLKSSRNTIASTDPTPKN